MIRINLLPHREEKRRARRQQFIALAGLVVAVSALVIFMVHGVLASRIGSQEEKNAFLKREIAALDKDIDEIKRLKEQTSALLSRKQVIETLQSNRSEAVGIFNELARLTPEGTYLKLVRQTGQSISLSGYAQSNARVSNLMHNLETSTLLTNPVLLEIHSATVGKLRLNEFNLTVRIKRDSQDEGKKGGKP